MTIDERRVRALLREFDYVRLFVEELGWDRYQAAPLAVVIDGARYTLSAVAEKRGMVVYASEPGDDGLIPDHATRRKIERQVAKAAYEHLIVYGDEKKTTQVWEWVRREPGRPAASRQHTYRIDQPGDSLIQKLRQLAFTLEEEESLTIATVAGRARRAFDVEGVTKRFYERFQTEHGAFLRFITGIKSQGDREWYASLMLNRLMFTYFIQKKGFLDGDPNYLRNRLAAMQEQKGKDKFLSFYRYFLLRLFHEGLGQQQHTEELDALLGQVPFLNGGLFDVHLLERENTDIQIPDAAFERIFDFFDSYQWHLDERPLRADNEINPDVLGYIFEKYINQKQMGAYYTKEDITEYIASRTVIPAVLEMAEKGCTIAFTPESAVWRLLRENPDRYIPAAVRFGSDIALPDDIAQGLQDVAKRAAWNEPAGAEYAPPTETWREHIERRERCEALRTSLAAGEIRAVGELINRNVDLRQFAQDVVENSEGPELLRAFYQAIQRVTIVDPGCGSGAFLFAALNILEPLYEAGLERMQSFLDDDERAGRTSEERFNDFRSVLARVDEHPSRRYFILKAIIIGNLFGVDIMEEAVEICKLRLFLKLAAQIDRIDDLEPLPDIDFNIRAGNSLVGFATYEGVRKVVTATLDFEGTMEQIEERAASAERAFDAFRALQQEREFDAERIAEAKDAVRGELAELRAELDRYLAREYGIGVGKSSAYEEWRARAQPFHWLVEFYGVVGKGGFDIVIGNPPYVEYGKVKNQYTVRGYESESSGNLYAFFLERSLGLVRLDGHVGMIVPVSSVCTDGYAPLQRLLLESGELVISSYNDRPGRLFEGLEHARLSIILCQRRMVSSHRVFTTKYNRWNTIERPQLFDRLSYIEEDGFETEGSIPKLSWEEEKDILRKLKTSGRTLGFYTTRTGQDKIFYTRKLSGFVQILAAVPTILDERGERRDPSELKTLTFESAEVRDTWLAIFNSNLFYWWLTIFSDCRNLNARELLTIPFDFEGASAKTRKELSRLVRRLMEDMEERSELRQMHYKRLGLTLRIQCFYPKLSKPIIDSIDEVLAGHYGFSDDELDLLVNYEIKYRLGQATEDNPLEVRQAVPVGGS
jgi:hypothetical protein